MKLQRHRKIIELVEEFEIETQKELAQRLHEAGYAVTQSTVSRDIRELNLQKNANGQGKQVYAPAQEQEQNPDAGDRNFRVLRDAFVSMDVSQNILVIRTASGMAMAAAAVLDDLKWEEILGCIAGDDTILCVAKSEKSSNLVMDRLRCVLKNTP